MAVDMDWEAISTALGYSSIVAWLGAQMPQLFENWRNGSVEGLALPFLVSWLAGDATNLLGCILTHQLPFQTYLATYFVFVDVGLMSQYIWYTYLHPPSTSQSHSHSARRNYKRASRSETWVSERNRSRKRRSRSKSHRSLREGEDPMEQSWMSESSAGYSPASSRPHTVPSHSRRSSHPSTSASTSNLASATSTEPPSPTIPERGRSLYRPVRASYSGPLATISGSPASGSPVPAELIDGQLIVDEPVDWVGSRRQQTGSSSRSRPPNAARRSQSMVFLSVGLLVTFGGWRGSQFEGGASDMGRAWPSTPEMGAVLPSKDQHGPEWMVLRHPAIFPRTSPSLTHPRQRKRRALATALPVTQSSASEADYIQEEPIEPQGDGYPSPKRDMERFIGRASAWVCTTLYLTSRLPQIWQNYRRKSTEGLAILLFTMALVGNSLYVLSILTNPLASHAAYLLESMPYLLGSGGTVCFDITIIIQAYLYSDKRRTRLERTKRRSLRHGVDAEEAAALLHGIVDGDDDEDETETGDGESTAGRRSRSVSRGGRSTSSASRKSHGRSDSTQLAAAKRFRLAGVSPYGHEHGNGDTVTQLDDRDFDFPGSLSSSISSASGASTVNTNDGNPSRSVSRGDRSRTTSVEPEVDVIVEEGESSVTIRP
ncbi:hypothetical protein T439DRAFT_310412 [Meredithblackwellia eburnea MCA 4105]